MHGRSDHTPVPVDRHFQRHPAARKPRCLMDGLEALMAHLGKDCAARERKA
jgi:hypothetical protein